MNYNCAAFLRSSNLFVKINFKIKILKIHLHYRKNLRYLCATQNENEQAHITPQYLSRHTL